MEHNKAKLDTAVNEIYDRLFCAKDRNKEQICWDSLIQQEIDKAVREQCVPEYITDSVEERYYSKLFAQLKRGAFLQNCKDLYILEIGSGFGILSYYFHKAGAHCTLVDKSQFALSYSRLVFEKTPIAQNEMKQRVDFVEANCEQLPLADNKYDLVCSMGLIEHSHVDAGAVLTESVRVAKTGGKIVFGVPNYFSPEALSIWYKFGKGTEKYLRKKILEGLYKQHGLVNVFSEASTFFFPYFTPRYIVERLSFLENFLGKTLRMGFLNITFGTKI